MQEKRPLWKRILRFILTALLSAVLIAMFYVAAVMGQPQRTEADAAEAQAEQPLPAPLASALRITDEKDINRLSEVFPAPILCPAYGNALVFVEGVCNDAPFENGVGRIVTLTYRAEDYSTLTITSMYPARALAALMGMGDYSFSSSAGQLLATLRSVRMENGTSIRLHAQGDKAVYVFTVPNESGGRPITNDVLRQWTSTLQLYVGGE